MNDEATKVERGASKSTHGLLQSIQRHTRSLRRDATMRAIQSALRSGNNAAAIPCAFLASN